MNDCTKVKCPFNALTFKGCKMTASECEYHTKQMTNGDMIREIFNSIEIIREWIDNAPTVPAIPISVIEQIKAEIGSEMNVTRDQYSIRQNDYCDGFVFAMKQVLEIIDKHIKEYTE